MAAHAFDVACTHVTSASKLPEKIGSSRTKAYEVDICLPEQVTKAFAYVALGPVRSVFVHSEGGLAVDARHRVLGADDKPLPGLYAAGSTGQGGLLLKGQGHHLAWAFVSGRRAGRFAAQAVEDNPAR